MIDCRGVAQLLGLIQTPDTQAGQVALSLTLNQIELRIANRRRRRIFTRSLALTLEGAKGAPIDHDQPQSVLVMLESSSNLNLKSIYCRQESWTDRLRALIIHSVGALIREHAATINKLACFLCATNPKTNSIWRALLVFVCCASRLGIWRQLQVLSKGM